MRNVGTLKLDVYLMPYEQTRVDAQYKFLKNSIEPLMVSVGQFAANPQIMALGPYDYGYLPGPMENGYGGSIDPLSPSWQYDGSTLVNALANADSNDPTQCYIEFLEYGLAPYGSNVGGITYSNTPENSPRTYTGLAGDRPYINAILPMGACPLAQDGGGVSNFTVPYCMYGYFNVFLASPQGKKYAAGGDGEMMEGYPEFNVGFNNGTSVTNNQGTIVTAGSETGAYFLPFKEGGYLPRSVPEPNPEPTTSTVLGLPTEAALQDIWSNSAGPGGLPFLQNGTDFVVVMGGQMFEGQPQTPVLVNLETQTYSPVQLTGHSAEANALIAQASGMDMSYSKIQDCFYFSNQADPNQYQIFFTEKITIDLPPVMIPPVPKLRFPCYGVQAPRSFHKR